MPRFSVSIAILAACALLAAAAQSFTDVDAAHPYLESITEMRKAGVVEGYPDGSFRPDRTVTRAEFAKLLILASADTSLIRECAKDTPATFRDVPKTAWYAPHVCAAVKMKVVEGRPDGEFHPADPITLAEAAKMATVAFGVSTWDGIPTEPWYKPFIQDLAERFAVPQTLGHPAQRISRAEVTELLWRLKADVRDRPSVSAQRLLGTACVWLDEEPVPGVDMEEVRRTWLNWYNDVRRDLHLTGLNYNRNLTRTATLWSRKSRDAGSITHKRPGQSAYYDYNRMVDWFADFDLEFKNVSRITFTENIGYGYYNCKSDDCTGALIQAVKSTLEFFLSEKGKAYAPHYDSIVNPHYRLVGLGLALDAKSKKYYLTVHYGTEIVSDPAPVCP